MTFVEIRSFSRHVRCLSSNGLAGPSTSACNFVPHKSRRIITLLVVFVTVGSLLWSTGLSRHDLKWSPRVSQQESTLRDHLSSLFPYNASSDLPKLIWQTWKTSSAEEGFDPRFRPATTSWDELNSDFKHEVIADAAAAELVRALFAGVPAVFEAYDALPKPVLKADFSRYLVLLACGGVYSDIDTTVLKSISHWVPIELEPFGLGVGIEADPDRPDWHDWYARRIQFCQWTIMSKPGHPVLGNIVASITEETLKRKTQNELQPPFMKTVMEFTGPGIWTDSIFNHLKISQLLDESTTSNLFAVSWQVFANLREPMKLSDVLILPITSFSPGVGHMGSKSSGDRLAFVSHGFSGTWKHDERSVDACPES